MNKPLLSDAKLGVLVAITAVTGILVLFVYV